MPAGIDWPAVGGHTPAVDRFFLFETRFCIRVYMESRTSPRRVLTVRTYSYPVSVVFSDVDAAFAMSRRVLPHRVPMRRLVCLFL
jgi:hypothetical protein